MYEKINQEEKNLSLQQFYEKKVNELLDFIIK